MSDISTNLASLFKRHVVFQNKKHIELYPYLRSMNVSNRRHAMIKFIWGLMSPEERNEFINDYLLDNMTV